MYAGERFNGYSHLVGAILAVAGTVILVTLGALKADPWRIASFSIYGATLCLLYISSTLYHSIRGRAKGVLRKLDHCAIYLIIAGTYTPFALVTLNGPWGWSIFGAIWGLAAAGIAQELWLKAKGTRLVSLALYLSMGWLAVVALVPLARALSWAGMAWLVAGGLAYTGGIVFYVHDERFRHWHGLWHLCVLAGSAAHYVAILRFVA